MKRHGWTLPTRHDENWSNGRRRRPTPLLRATRCARRTRPPFVLNTRELCSASSTTCVTRGACLYDSVHFFNVSSDSAPGGATRPVATCDVPAMPHEACVADTGGAPTGEGWQCARCRQDWDASRLATVAAYAAWVAEHESAQGKLGSAARPSAMPTPAHVPENNPKNRGEAVSTWDDDGGSKGWLDAPAQQRAISAPIQ